jgi:hypothetical protein
MKDLPNSYINKDCIISTLSGATHIGIITTVSESAIEIQEKDIKKIVNMDFIVSIMEYPKNKNGKRKTVIT